MKRIFSLLTRLVKWFTSTLFPKLVKLLPCMAVLGLIKVPLLPYQPPSFYLPAGSQDQPHYFLKHHFLSLEELIRAHRAELGLGGATLNLKMRSEIGQGLSIALLGGFRGIVADFVWIGAHRLWEEQKWYKIKQYFDVVMVLQPHATFFWDSAAWHMAWNISYSERARCIHQNLPEAPCIAAQEFWIAQGRHYLEEGIASNPNDWELYFRLGWLIFEKQPDRVCESIPYYLHASTFPEAPRYIARQVGFAQEQCGKFADAYQTWLRLWNECLQDRRFDEVPSVIWHKGRELEEIMQIPDAQRVFWHVPESKVVELSR